jgi:hypothetical protein
LRDISLQDVRDFYLKYIHPLSESRRKISIWSHAKGPVNLKVSSDAVKLFCGESSQLEKLLDQTLLSEFSSGQVTLLVAISQIRDSLEQNSDLTPNAVEQAVFKFIRCVRRCIKGKTYNLVPSVDSIHPTKAISNVKDFRSSLVVSNAPYRVIMPLKPPPPSRI